MMLAYSNFRNRVLEAKSLVTLAAQQSLRFKEPRVSFVLERADLCDAFD